MAVFGSYFGYHAYTFRRREANTPPRRTDILLGYLEVGCSGVPIKHRRWRRRISVMICVAATVPY